MHEEKPQETVYTIAEKILATKRALDAAKERDDQEQILLLTKRFANLDAWRKQLEEKP